MQLHMNNNKKVNFYLVTHDLTAIQRDDFEACAAREDCFYIIKETLEQEVGVPSEETSLDNRFEIELLDATGHVFSIHEGDWKVIEMGITGPQDRRKVVYMNIADPAGKIIRKSATRDFYNGVLQLHKSLRYLSLFASWETADAHSESDTLKKLFIRLKNGHTVSRSIYINPDEDYLIDLAFKNGCFIMNSCIVEGDIYDGGCYKDEEQYQQEDFYHFMKIVLDKFPQIILREAK